MRTIIWRDSLRWGANRSGDDAQLPRHELVLSITVRFAFRRGPGCAFEHALEDEVAEFSNRGVAVHHAAAIDLHVALLPFPQRCIGREFQRRRWRAAVCGTAPGRETDQIGA